DDPAPHIAPTNDALMIVVQQAPIAHEQAEVRRVSDELVERCHTILQGPARPPDQRTCGKTSAATTSSAPTDASKDASPAARTPATRCCNPASSKARSPSTICSAVPCSGARSAPSGDGVTT